MRTASDQIAFDKGYGSRCISHYRDNPYDRVSEASRHAAWERGYEKADAEAGR